MADLKISQLPAKTTVSAADIFAVVNGTATDSITGANLFLGKGPAIYVASSTATASEKLIADFTATGSADDATIQSALSALTAGGTIFLSSGTFNIASTINITQPGTMIIGQGWGGGTGGGGGSDGGTILKLNNGVNKYVFAYVPAANVRMDGVVIAHLKIDCNNTNQSGTSGGIDALGASYNVFEHLWIEAPYTYGISLHGDNLGGFGHHNNVRSCWFHNGSNSPASIGVGLHITSSDENMIYGNDFEANGGTVASAAQLFEDSGLQMIYGNTFVGNPNVGSVEHIKRGGGNSSIISNNTFDGGTNAQVELSSYDVCVGNNFFQPISAKPCILAGNLSCTIIGNTFTSAVANGASDCAVDASAGTNNIIINNVVKTVGSWNSAIFKGTGTNHIHSNQGFTTENSGTAAVAGGTTSIAVSHGLSYTPLINDISVTPTNNFGSATKFWTSGVTSTQFTVNVNTDPGTTTAAFVWSSRGI